MRISALEAIAAAGGRIGLWGWGREGRAAHSVLRARLPGVPLTLFCTEADRASAVALGDDGLIVDTHPDADALARHEVVVKSPGISPYSPEATAARAAGTRFAGGTGLWFAEKAGPDGVVAGSVCVTGTKGKSTTTALLAHLLRAAGHRTALAGNIGLPLLDLLSPDPPPAWWAIELSSYQTGDVADSGGRPAVAVVTNVHPEHLDWHGGEQRYVEDKLKLVTQARPRITVLNAADPTLAALELPGSEVRWYGREDGWHLRGDEVWRGDSSVIDTRGMPLPGRHNRGNLCAVLAAIEALGLDALSMAPAAFAFEPLPHRLQSLGRRDGIEYVNDSISTTPYATLAALGCYRGRKVAVLVGGHDRGIDWSGFATGLHDRMPRTVVTMGANGGRIADLLESEAPRGGFELIRSATLQDAMAVARERLQGEGVMLLSPGAPSFGPFKDYVDRGRAFAREAGFDPDGISVIPGLGIA